MEQKNSKSYSIKAWERVGGPKEIYRSKFGQYVLQQDFIHPIKGTTETYIFHGEDDGVRIFALTKDRKVVAVREYQQAVDKVMIQLPTGAIKKGENVFAAAKRELEEETGYGSDEMIDLGVCYPLPRSCPTVEYCFLAKNCRKINKQHLDRNEFIEILEIPLAEWIGMIQNGAVSQNASVFATFKAFPYLGISCDVK